MEQEAYKRYNKHRRVNSTLGKSPSIGPIPSDQLLPWGIILFFALLVQNLLDLNWTWTILIVGWGVSSWWILTANGAWRILSKFINPPNWIREVRLYKPILKRVNGKIKSSR